MSGSDQDWRSSPRRQLIRNRPIDRTEHTGARPHRCPVCKSRLEYDTDMNGKAVELVRDKGVRYVHECA